MQPKLTQWNKMGDHPLVKDNICQEFEYLEAQAIGCGFINTFIIVYPTDYIVEINNIYVGVIKQQIAELILQQQ